MIGRGRQGGGGAAGGRSPALLVAEGTALLREAPLAAAPLAAHCEPGEGGGGAVCYGCLRPLRGRPPPAPAAEAPLAAPLPLPPPPPPPAPPPPSGGGGEGPPPPPPAAAAARSFCSPECRVASLPAFFGVESETPGGGFRELEESCTRHGERFPRIAARLFARKLFAATLGDGGGGGGGGGERAAAATEATAIREAAREAEEALAALCFARVRPPYPPSWVETHGAFVRGLERWAQGREAWDEAAAAARATPSSLSSLIAATVPLDAWADALARIHLNAFRVDAVWPATTREELMASMLSSLVGGAGSGMSKGSSSSFNSSEDDSGGEQAGTAIYAAASLANHSCYPTARPSFPRADATLALVATRDLSEGDEVTISYVDESLPLGRRRASLEFAYGFFCRCERCLAEEEEEGGRGGGGGG